MPQGSAQLIQIKESGGPDGDRNEEEAGKTGAVGCHCRGGEARSREALNSVIQVVEFQSAG